MQTVFSNEFNVIYVRVVQGCNLNCDHCFTLGDKDPYMLTDTNHVNKFLQSIKNNVDPKKATFYIHGGETFLAPYEHLKEVNDIIRKTFGSMPMDIIPQTNLLYKVDDEFIEFIKKEYRGTLGVSWDADIRFGSISINKKTEQEDLFFSNFKKLIEAGINVHISITAQKYLLSYDPLEIVRMFDGADSIDFELLTTFDEKTRNLKPNNEKWANWLNKLVDYYEKNETNWCLPQIDLFTKSLINGKLFDCKCNCCDKRTFTLNPNGTVGFCPDKTYIEPVSNVDEMINDWKKFEDKAVEVIINKLTEMTQHEMCFSCEHYDICGGNCDASLFDETDECPLSKKVISRIRNNKQTFIKLYENRALKNLTELRKNYELYSN
jgi:radical SAM protein with 4Fe4S-binding SPASM domain